MAAGELRSLELVARHLLLPCVAQSGVWRTVYRPDLEKMGIRCNPCDSFVCYQENLPVLKSVCSVTERARREGGGRARDTSLQLHAFDLQAERLVRKQDKIVTMTS